MGRSWRPVSGSRETRRWCAGRSRRRSPSRSRLPGPRTGWWCRGGRSRELLSPAAPGASAGSARCGRELAPGFSRRCTRRWRCAAGSGTARRRRGPWRPVRGSVENLNVSRRQGCSFQSRQIRATDANEIPRCFASRRADQCVTPSDSGGEVKVATTTSASSITGGRPDRSRSPNAFTPPASYRLRHWITVWRLIPTRRAISAFGRPSAASSTIRARCANPASTVEDRTSALRFSSSPARSTRGAATDT